MQKENEVVESKVDKFINQRGYEIGSSQFGKLYAELKNKGINSFVVRVIVSANENNVHASFREIGLLSDIPEFKLTKDQVTFQTIEAAGEWLKQFATEHNWIENWT